MSWNYRVMAVPHPQNGWKEVHLAINDIYYDDNGMPESYGILGEPPTFRDGETVSGDTIKEIRVTLKLMAKALKKPILCGGDRWPEEYKP